MSRRTAIVIGAGIAGLATARALGVRGYKVKVIERTQKATGASIRNFGMIWLIGQPDGKLYERALTSRSIWKQICTEAKIWHDEVGSLQIAQSQDEWDVLQEAAALYPHRNYAALNVEQTLQKSPAVRKDNLHGGMYSPNEIIIDPRQAIAAIPGWLTEKFGVEFIWGKAITDIAYPTVFAGKESFEADEIYVCNGADFETLYPEIFSTLPLTKCKLQMMRMKPQPGSSRIGPALCGGLSLIHYSSFKPAASLEKLKKRYELEYPEHLKYGIHVMVSQNETGELTVGDSHEYGLTPDPFDKSFINDMILEYLKGFTNLSNNAITQSWHGIYPKLTNGETDLILDPEQGVTIINGYGGGGMTLSFAVSEEVISKK